MYINGKKVWYAVMMDNEDTDHGTGSFNKREAVKKAKWYRENGYPDAYIALIDPEEDFCFDEMREF